MSLVFCLTPLWLDADFRACGQTISQTACSNSQSRDFRPFSSDEVLKCARESSDNQIERRSL